MKHFLATFSFVMLAACGTHNNTSSAPTASTASFPQPNLIRLIMTCTTSDEKYSVTIADNQGNGLNRTSHLYAQVQDAENNLVGNYAPIKLVSPGPMRSVSFGHDTYVDAATNGQQFRLDLRSTNTPYTLTAVLMDGSKVIYGNRTNTANQGSLKCTPVSHMIPPQL